MNGYWNRGLQSFMSCPIEGIVVLSKNSLAARTEGQHTVGWITASSLACPNINGKMRVLIDDMFSVLSAGHNSVGETI